MRAIRSIERQSWPDYEIVIVDDRSSPPLATTIGDRQHCRIILSEGNGASAARNTGIRASAGDYIALLDSDDEFLPGKLTRMAAAIADHPDAILYSRVVLDHGRNAHAIVPSRPLRHGERMPDFLFAAGEMIATPSLVVPATLARAVSWDETLGYGDDSDWLIRLWQHGACFHFIPESLVRCDMTHGLPHLSAAGSAEQMEQWIRNMRHVLGTRAELCYRATHLIALRGRLLSWWALRDAGVVILGGLISPMAVARAFARGLLPRTAYRALHRLWLRSQATPRRQYDHPYRIGGDMQ
ncbi:glycosyltransferase family 2 protein [Rhodoligotrophos ferricapiens]|uniref:glycosyltransferase family 2 protein n=1 Tax=Rhodoligotrophos ferricapiens TaxID=3069264 RepID=UPI00315C664E